MRSLFCKVLAAFLLIALVGAAPTNAIETAKKPSCAVTDRPVFNDPAGNKAEQFKIMTYVKQCVRASRKGSYISIATPHYESIPLSKALVWADRNGRHVRVILTQNDWRRTAVKMLRKQLGTDTSRRSYLKLCKGSCVTDLRDGSMHNKLFMFSAPGNEQHVTMISSINPNATQSNSRYNDLYAVTNKTIYKSTVSYFRQMKYNQPAKFPAVVTTKKYEMWYMPTFDQKRPDFYQQRLNQIRCDTARSAGRNGKTVVRWMAPQLRNVPELAERAVQMVERGCKLSILLPLNKTGPRILWKLLRGDVKVRYHWPVNDRYLNHSKVLVISGTYRGDVVDTVYTGTRNPVDSQEVTDNTMLRIKDNKGVAEAYSRRFYQIWKTAHPLTKKSIKAYAASQEDN